MHSCIVSLFVHGAQHASLCTRFGAPSDVTHSMHICICVRRPCTIGAKPTWCTTCRQHVAHFITETLHAAPALMCTYFACTVTHCIVACVSWHISCCHVSPETVPQHVRTHRVHGCMHACDASHLPLCDAICAFVPQLHAGHHNSHVVRMRPAIRR